MNLIAIDIGNTNIKVAFYLDDEEKLVESVGGSSTEIEDAVGDLLFQCWEQVPFVKSAVEPVRDCAIVASSVKPDWTEMVERLCKAELKTKMLLIGRDVSLPIETSVDQSLEVGTDRLVNAAAAFAVVENAVIVADFGTAVTVDLVDSDGVFVGGTICPGFDLQTRVLHEGTAKLPLVKMQKPVGVYGSNTEEAIRAGLYYSAVGFLETICRKYAEQIGYWPQVVVTGAAAPLFKEDCEFVDNFVSNLALRGIVVAYKKHLFEKAHIDELAAAELEREKDKEKGR